VRAWGEGGTRLVHFADTDPSEWEALMRVNLTGVLHVTHTYLADMIERGWGRILTIVSDAGRRGERRQVVYGAAKAAAMGFSRGLAAEVGRQGVTVNCISLGSMQHGSLQDAVERDPELGKRLSAAYPVGRLGRVDDPAPLAVLLCSDAAEWITGQVYPVDGGFAPAL
jgi:3-oxoacyl-[acyl-carrier protein] reductase